jgi:putative transcriptional regulator
VRAPAAGFLTAFVSCLAGLPAALEGPDPRGLKPGVFLYAVPELGPSPFAESVVLLVQHGEDGSLGLIVNRPTSTPVREVLKDLGPLDLDLYVGGPVQPDAALALVRSASPVGDAARVLPDVYFCTDLEPIRRLARAGEAQSRVRIYAGYAGWSPGQLAEELRNGVWVIGPANARSIFSPEPETVWPRVHELLRRLETRAPRAKPDHSRALATFR